MGLSMSLLHIECGKFKGVKLPGVDLEGKVLHWAF